MIAVFPRENYDWLMQKSSDPIRIDAFFPIVPSNRLKMSWVTFFNGQKFFSTFDRLRQNIWPHSYFSH
jgi:hypothetical protein